MHGSAFLLVALGSTIACSNTSTNRQMDSDPLDDVDATDAGAKDPVDTTLRSYDPADSNIQYSGRIDWSDPEAPRYSAPGVTVTAHFRGDSISARFRDQFQYGRNNYYDVVVDGEITRKLTPDQRRTRYELATELEPGKHTVTLVKRTEASIGTTTFLGLEIGGELLPPEPESGRRIEFIGDSILAGAGVEATNNSSECSEDTWGQPYNNGFLSLGPVAARLVDADYHLSAVSGIGLVRSYSLENPPMPEVFDQIFMEDRSDDPLLWDFAEFVPDVVVIGLGTNDFSPGDSERPKMDVDEYTEAYIQFVTRLRGYYPDAHLVAMSSPMLGDGWPDSTYTSATDLKTVVQRVEDHFAEEGDEAVSAFLISRNSGGGCGTHPNVAQHAELAEELAEELRSLMGW